MMMLATSFVMLSAVLCMNVEDHDDNSDQNRGSPSADVFATLHDTPIVYVYVVYVN